jgi:hypothetical protein
MEEDKEMLDTAIEILDIAGREIVDYKVVTPPGEEPELVLLVDYGIMGIRKMRVKYSELDKADSETEVDSEAEYQKPPKPKRRKKGIVEQISEDI